MKLQRKYGISIFEVVLCRVIRFIKGSKGCPKFI